MNPRQQRALNFYRLLVANIDFGVAEDAASMMTRFHQEKAHKEFTIAFYAFVIAYAKPFVGSKHTGPLPKEWSRFSSDAFRSLHKKILEWRNTMIAHSDPSIVRPILIPPGCELRIGEKKDLLIVRKITEMSFAVRYETPPRDQIACCDELARHQRERVLVRLAEEKDTLFDPATLPDGPFELTLEQIRKLT